jgi:uncharacterized integral membrane protein
MSETPARGSRPSNRTIARLAGATVAVLLLLVFVFQNGRDVRLRFLFWEADLRLAWALIVAALLGVLIGIALPRLRRIV